MASRCLFRGATPLLVLQFQQFVGECLGGRPVVQHAHGTVVGLVDNLPQFPGHVHPDLAAFGQIPADHAVPVLVASPLPAGVRVGEVRVHARLVAQTRVAGEPGAVVVRDADARAGRQRGGHRQPRPDAFPCGLAGHDPGHEEPGLAFDLGVRVASGADHAVGLPMAETAPVVRLRRAPRDGDPSGDREPRRPPAATPATPPVAAWKAARPAFTAMAVGVDPPVDGLRAHAHGGVVGEQDAQPAADEQRRPAATRPFGHPRPQAFA